MSVFKTKTKLILLTLITMLVALLVSVVAVLAAQRVTLNANVNVNYYSPKTLATNLQSNLGSATTLTFDYYDNRPESLTHVAAVDASSVGCDNGGISLYKNSGTDYYVLSKTEILAPASCYQLFYNLNKLTSISFNNFNTENVTDMSYMLRYCYRLSTIDGLNKFNTSRVTTMMSMFFDCGSLESLDLSSFNTGQVIDMSLMFCGCSSLTFLDISNFNTSNVTDMRAMFQYCTNLISLNASNINLSKISAIIESAKTSFPTSVQPPFVVTFLINC